MGKIHGSYSGLALDSQNNEHAWYPELYFDYCLLFVSCVINQCEKHGYWPSLSLEVAKWVEKETLHD